MKPYFTILLDSFRMLKSTAIFWVTLGISLLVALIYLSIGFDEKGMSFLFGLAPIENELFKKGTWQSETLYVAIFTKLIAEYWLSWVAVLLALISCASIFPEALQEGSAGMVLTKKLTRFKVFVAKFAGSLLFVTIQVVLFVTIVFIAMKLRLGSWNPSVFWYVPLILLVFTYLYSFMVLVAVKTRSAMTALILTLALWLVSSIIGVVEGTMYGVMQRADLFEQITTGKEEVDDESDSGGWYQKVVMAYAVFPKTGRTLDVADRLLVINGKKGVAKGDFSSVMMRLAFESGEDVGISQEEIDVNEGATDRHSTGYAIGTSMVFALVMLGLAAWIFCRKEI